MMDDRTAYHILKIKPGTTLSDIDKKYELFVKLYKRYLMGETLEYTPGQLAKMKEAYESLLYKRINDEELQYLYPRESQSIGYQAWKLSSRLAGPFLRRHRGKVIYTLVMSMLTLIIILIINYQPVDLKITVIHDPIASMMEYHYRTQLIDAFKMELQEYLSAIQKPVLEYQSLFSDEGLSFEDLSFFSAKDVDVYVMEEEMLISLSELGLEFTPLDFSGDKPVYAPTLKDRGSRNNIKVDQRTTFYQYLCNLNNDNQVWVAVVPTQSEHKEKALWFLRYISTPDE